MSYSYIHVFEKGFSVIQEHHTEEGDWYPPVILPYFWKDGTLWVCCCCPEMGYDKACPVDAATKWTEHTDFFLIRGTMLWAYPKTDGYLPVFLEDLQGQDALLF
jgi:hypothetical protein